MSLPIASTRLRITYPLHEGSDLAVETTSVVLFLLYQQWSWVFLLAQCWLRQDVGSWLLNLSSSQP